MGNLQTHIAPSETQTVNTPWVGTHHRLTNDQPLIAEGGKRLHPQKAETSSTSPLVSVVTVCFNSAETIQQTIASVQAQTYHNIEHIIIDGGSTDGTLDILERHAHQLDYFASQADKGLYDAINKAIGLAAGDYIIILNSDDWYHETCIEKLLQALKYSNADFVSALAQYVDQSGKPVENVNPMPFDESVYLRMPLRHETMLVPAKLYETIGPYSLDYSIISDLDIAIRLFDQGYAHYEVRSPLLYFRNTGLSNRRRDILLEERKLILARQFPALTSNELELLAVHGKLTPAAILTLIDKYRTHTKFVETLYAYYTYQQAHSNAAAWAGCPPFPLASLGGPSVSIILPVYNAEKTLHQCMESLLKQTLSDIEIICIDDCSTDRSPEILRTFQASDNRISLYQNTHNMGLGSNRNQGISKARGTYIFHVDPDDIVPAEALEKLYKHAEQFGGDMIKGAYVFSQTVHGQSAPVSNTRYCLQESDLPLVGTNLSQTKELLRTTEGHWSYLYKRPFALRVRYPRDLKMGQDSIFLVRALAEATNISVTDHIIYCYQANASSAMNSFNYQKYCDAVEWRRRAFHVLMDAGHQDLAQHIAHAYWSMPFYAHMAERLSKQETYTLFEQISELFSDTAAGDFSGVKNTDLKAFLQLLAKGQFDRCYSLIAPKANNDFFDLSELTESDMDKLLKEKRHSIATVSTFDHIGAGIGTARRVEALRDFGLDAQIYALVTRSGKDYVNGFKEIADHPMGPEEAWKGAVRNRRNSVGFRAQELFSSTYSAVDFSKNRQIVDNHDILHLHWAVGILDYDFLAEEAGNKPIVWTFADMNAFTGGCHYSEGCEEYKRACKKCPLIEGEQQSVHETWLYKKSIYDKLNNLRIVCPSKWLAKKVKESSLLGDREVYYIPNAFPTDSLTNHDRIEARKKLGLPLEKKLFLFGAQTLTSSRKGGQILKRALEHLEKSEHAADIEIVLYGKNSLDLNFPTHNLGFISDINKMALAYAASDAFLFPSREDNAPLTVVESLLCGTPVIAFPVGHVPDIVKDHETGYVAEYCNARSFAAGMDWAASLSATEADQMSERCARFARAYFDPQLSAKRHALVYEKATRHEPTQ